MKIGHFATDYKRLVAGLKGRSDEATAMARAVGGSYDAIGQIESDLLRMYGLRDGMRLIDLGCGSGRAATALARDFQIEYHGTDVVPDLLDYARRNTPATYRYSVVDKIEIPDTDACADMVCAFSLFTHLLHEETYIYLEEVKRVLKPGGTLVFSFLEFRIGPHWAVFRDTVKQAKAGQRPHLNMFIERKAIEAWARQLDMTIVDWQDSAEGPRIPLSRDVVTDDGQAMTGMAILGQSVCVMAKR